MLDHHLRSDGVVRRVPPGATSETPRVRLLGEYLVEVGEITAEELREALAWMDVVNTTVGQLAVERGLVSPFEADRVARLQQHADERWGDLALTLGVGDLTRAAIEELRWEQDARNLRLSDAIVQLGFSSPTTIDALRARFDAEYAETDPARSLPISYDGYPPVLHLLEGLPQLAARILRTPMRVSTCRPWTGEDRLAKHTTISLLGVHGVTIGLSACERLSSSVIERIIPTVAETSGEHEDPCVLRLSDFLMLAAQRVIRRLDEDPGGPLAGMQIAAVAPGSLPSSGIAFDLALGQGHGVLVVERTDGRELD